MIGKAKRRILIGDYDQEIEAWSEKKGPYGQGNIKTKLFTTLAKVEELSGYKALQYQQQGIGNPVLIEMNWIPVLPAFVMWNDNKIPITSFIDPDNHMKKRVVMLGSFTKTNVTLPYINPGLWTKFTILGEGWIEEDNNVYHTDGDQVSSSIMDSELALEAGESYLVNVTLESLEPFPIRLIFLDTSFTNPISERRIAEGDSTLELVSAGGVVSVKIDAYQGANFRINSIFKKD